MDINKLLEERGEQYGETWVEVGMVITILKAQFLEFAERSPLLVHNWVIIMSKMIRILHSPSKVDHWNDIAGYATLVSKFLEGKDVPSK